MSDRVAPVVARFCPECGRPCDASMPPVCGTHGPQWALARNAPAACVAIVRDGLVLVTQRVAEPWAGWWELPGGFQDLDEHPADTAVREAREEVGLDVTINGLIGIYLHHAADDDVRQVVTYVGTAVGDPHPDPAEVCDWRWVDPSSPPEPMVPAERAALSDLLANTPYHLAR